jgi:hypothetical protein
MRLAIHAALAVPLIAACGKVSVQGAPDGGGSQTDVDGGGGGEADAAPPEPDAARPACSWSAPDPGPFGNLNGTGSIESAALSGDELLVFYAFLGEGDTIDIYDAGRETLDQSFGGARLVEELVDPDFESEIELSGSTDEIFFVRANAFDIWRAGRVSPGGAFAAADTTGLLGRSPSLSGDGLHLYYIDRDLPQIMRADRAAPGEAFGEPTVVGDQGVYRWIDVSSDELTLLMSGGVGTPDESRVAIASRASLEEPFGEPVSAGAAFVPSATFPDYEEASWNADGSEVLITAVAASTQRMIALSTCQPANASR